MLTGRYLPTIGGAQHHVSKISQYLKEADNIIIILAEKDPINLSAVEILSNIPTYRAPIRYFKYFFSPFYFIISLLLCIRFKPDIIHAHFLLPSGLVSIVLSKLLKIPYVITLHGVDVLKDPEVKYGVRLNRLIDFISILTLRNAKYIIVCSQFMKRQILKHIKIKTRLEIIPNGIDNLENRCKIKKEQYRSIREQLKLKDKDILLFTARRLVPKNGIHYLLHAMKAVKNTNPNIKLFVAGQGPQHNELMNLVKSLCLFDSVRFLGEISYEDLEMMYTASDIVVLPSLVEPFGMTVLESMSYMVPIISFDSGGPTELIRENNIGIVVEKKNITAFANAIISLANSPDSRKTFALNCKKNTHKYDWKKIADQTLQYYTSIIRSWK